MNRIMMKRIGKIILFYFLSLANITQLYCQLNIRFLDEDRQEINECLIGEPFWAVAEYKSKENKTNILAPVINNFGGANFLGQSSNRTISYINLNPEVKLETFYKLQTYQTGRLNIGPALMPGTDLKSGIASINIVKETSSRKPKDLDVEVLFGKKVFYVNEKIKFIIRLIVNNPNITLLDINKPNDFENLSNNGHSQVNKTKKKQAITWGELSQPKSKVETINGKKVVNYEISGSFFPNEAGKILVAGLGVKYRVASNRQDILSQMMFGIQAKIKDAFALPEEIDILPLPKLQDPNLEINGVGDFTNYNFKIDKPIIDQFDAAILTISISGKEDVNWQAIIPPKIDLAKSINVYESKVWQEKKSESNIIKHFEYVITPTEHGQFKISPQDFIFFNPATNQLYKLSVSPVEISVNEKKLSAKNKNNLNNNLEGQKELEESEELEDLENLDVAKKIENLMAKNRIFPVIPNILFWLIFILPLIALIIIKYLNLNYLINLLNPKFSKKNIFKNLKTEVLKLEKSSEPNKLYLIFKKYLSSWFTKSKNKLLTDSQINEAMEKLLTTKDYKDWQIFYQNLAQTSSFSISNSAKSSKIKEQDIFRQSFDWIEKLKNIKISDLDLETIRRLFSLAILILLLNFSLFSANIPDSNKSNMLDKSHESKILNNNQNEQTGNINKPDNKNLSYTNNLDNSENTENSANNFNKNNALKLAVDLSRLYKHYKITGEEYLDLREELAESIGREDLVNLDLELENKNYFDNIFIYLSFIPYIFLQIIFLIIWLFILFLVYKNRYYLSIALTCLELFILLLLFAASKRVSIASGIINKESSSLRSGIGENYPEISKLYLLDEVKIVDKSCNSKVWCLVSVNNTESNFENNFENKEKVLQQKILKSGQRFGWIRSEDITKP